MPTTDFSRRDVVKVLRRRESEFVTRSGSHVQIRYVTDGGEVRNVTVPMHDRVQSETLRNIADQCGATEFDEWCR